MSLYRRSLQLVFLVGLLVASPLAAHAQEATLTGTAIDSTGGVLPGVSVVAVHVASGNTFEAVTDDRGAFRISLRVGAYRVTAQLAGFGTVTRAVELLVGQQATLNLQLSPSTVQESVTVTGEAPLIDTSSSTLPGNIDPRQVSDLPVNGRNWLDLSMLAPGNRSNAVSDAPTDTTTTGTFQLNVDGQQVTQTLRVGNGEPRFSRDAIAEFEFIANRFDATQGRSAGVQVNAVTKSGTNTFAGTTSGYFRSDRLNAADLVAKRVLPYQDQQVSLTFGGPIRKDRMHFFANYEYEREPRTIVFSTPYPEFNLDMQTVRAEQKGGGRFDMQMSTKTHLTVRGAGWREILPVTSAGGATVTPTTAAGSNHYSAEVVGSLVKAVSSRTLNELKAGYFNFWWSEYSDIRNANAMGGGYRGAGWGAPAISLRGLTIGGAQTSPQDFNIKIYSLRDDVTRSYNRFGRHDMKLGGEYLHQNIDNYVCRSCFGVLTANTAAVPANITSLFPNLFDAATWNLQPLSPITTTYSIGVGKFDFPLPRDTFSGWIQDDVQATSRLTINVGARYDFMLGAYMTDVTLGPFFTSGRKDDTNNLAPRLGAVYKLDDRTIIRGGWGLFFGEPQGNQAAKGQSLGGAIQFNNDGRADFAVNPNNGRPLPTFEQVIAPGSGYRRAITTQIPDPRDQVIYSHQASVGFQRQIGDTAAVSADYVFTGTRNIDSKAQNINLGYDPATGVNYPNTDTAHLPYPDWGQVSMAVSDGARSNNHGLQTVFTKRLSHRWQASANYTLSMLKDADAYPHAGLVRVPFATAPDLGGQYTLAATDQRHRAVFNGIFDAGHGLQVSGLYFYGSGQRYSTNYGGDQRRALVGSGRLRPDGTIAPRNNLAGSPIHRVDMRLQERIRIGRRSIDGIVELFNVFDHANYGAYTTSESNAAYGKPAQSSNVAYAPREVQLGFRVAF
jgi:hypothetical protein